MRAIRILVVILLLVVVGGLVLRLSGLGLFAGPQVTPGSALLLDLEGSYVEAPDAPLVSRLLGQAGVPLVNVLSELRKAARDDRIGRVVVRIRGLDVGWAKAQELRDAMAGVRSAGKPVIAYVEVERFGASREYYVATAADQIWFAPGTRIPFVGLAADYFFLGGLWEKLGIQVEVERVGKYKSMAEMLAANAMSDDNREMVNSIMDSIESQLVAGIADRRALSASQVRAILDQAPVTPAQMQEAGLIDGVAYLDQVMEKLGSPPVVEGSTYAGVDPRDIGFAPQATFALVYGTGPVVHGEGRDGMTGGSVLASTTLARHIEQAAEDSEIGAIVFRVDSGGGSALASDIVYRAVQEAKEKKPVVVSFSDVAASGGYYVGAAGDAIVAQPGTLTGSIGVFVVRPVVGGFLDKLGIGYEGITRGAHADILLATQPLDEASRERLEVEVRSVYELFIDRVAQGRSLEPAYVDEVGQGRVWTGVQANERKLVTLLGGLHTAVNEAKERAGIDRDTDVALMPYPPPEPLAAQLARLFSGGASTDSGLRAAFGGGAPAAALATLPPAARRVASWLLELPTSAPLLVPPVVIDVH